MYIILNARNITAISLFNLENNKGTENSFSIINKNKRILFDTSRNELSSQGPLP